MAACCTTTWHWVDPDLGAAKAAAVLRDGGRLGVFWNCGRPEPEIRATFERIYAEVAPGVDSHSVVLGRLGDDRFDVAADAIEATRQFGPVERTAHTWAQRYTTSEWLDHLPTHSDHQGLPDRQLDRLLGRVAGAIDERGGSFLTGYDTVVIAATRRDARST